MAGSSANLASKYVGKGLSDHPNLAKWLIEEGIESVSLDPDRGRGLARSAKNAKPGAAS